VTPSTTPALAGDAGEVKTNVSHNTDMLLSRSRTHLCVRESARTRERERERERARESERESARARARERERERGHEPIPWYVTSVTAVCEGEVMLRDDAVGDVRRRGE